MATYGSSLAAVVAVVVIVAAAAAFLAAGVLLAASIRRRSRVVRVAADVSALRRALLADRLGTPELGRRGRSAARAEASAAEGRGPATRTSAAAAEARWALRRRRSAEWEGLFTLRAAARGERPLTTARGAWLGRFANQVADRPRAQVGALDDLESLPAELLQWAAAHAPGDTPAQLVEAMGLLEVDRDVRDALATDPSAGLTRFDVRREDLQELRRVRGVQRPGKPG